jgi:hypothetical protein
MNGGAGAAGRSAAQGKDAILVGGQPRPARSRTAEIQSIVF